MPPYSQLVRWLGVMLLAGLLLPQGAIAAPLAQEPVSPFADLFNYTVAQDLSDASVQ